MPVEHFFRHEYGRLVAVLSRRVGVQHIQAIEDAAQFALMTALQTWPQTGEPDHAFAWLLRVASNDLLSALRRDGGHRRILATQNAIHLQACDLPPVPEPGFDSEVTDDLLRMLFLCCDPSIPVESQLVFALKTLCGFSIQEIALRLFISEANVYKRVSRARSRLRVVPDLLHEELDAKRFSERLPGVRTIVYLLFTEGHLSSQSEFPIRRELCFEAQRLTTILAEHPVGQTPQSFALLALMHFHTARMTARQDDCGGLLLLEEQDRSAWDQDEIAKGLYWLAQSAEGEQFSRYHAEAGIAAEHCLAPSVAMTRWDRIVSCYLLLEETTSSPIHRLNRAVAVAEWKGPQAGLAVLQDAKPPTWLVGSYLWSAVLADLHRRCGNTEQARHYRESALQLAPSEAVRETLERRLQADRAE